MFLRAHSLRLFKKKNAKIELLKQYDIQLASIKIILSIKRNPRSKKISLRLDPTATKATINIPKSASLKNALDFFEKSKPWLMKQLPLLDRSLKFEDGTEFPFLGKKIRIAHKAAKLTQLYLEDKTLHITCKRENIECHITHWLKREAYVFLEESSYEYASKLGAKIKKIQLKDTKSRWGSCSSQGNINYSWRLILAPKEIANYVCAHEVSHLIEMNHSPAFWRIVASLCPNYSHERKWLKVNGKTLF